MVLTNTELCCYGDSLTQRGGGVTASGAAFSSKWTPASSDMGFIICASGNRLFHREFWNFGVGSQTSEGLLGRIDSTRIDNGSSGGANPALAITGQAADGWWNVLTTGEVAPSNTGSMFGAVEVGTNDTTFASAQQTMTAIATDVDKLIAGGMKCVAVSNLFPRGRCYVLQEAKTIVSGTTNYAASLTTFIEDASVGGDIAVQLVVSGVVTVFSKVVGTPGHNQFSMSGSTFVISSADSTTYAGLTLFVSYIRETTGFKTPPAYGHDKDVSEWVSSTAPVFTGTYSGTTYGISGLCYNRPQVLPIDTFGAFLDGSTSGANERMNGYLSTDGVHRMPRGSLRAGRLYASRYASRFPTLTSQARTPTLNNWTLATGNTVATSWNVTLPVAMRGTPAAGSLITIRCNSGKIGTVNATTGVITGDFSGTVSFTGSLFTVTAVGHTPGSSQKIVYCADDDNLIINGLFDINHGNGTAHPAAITGATLPLRWSNSVDSGTTTAVSAGQLSITCSIVADPSGFGSAIKYVITGLAGTGTPALTLLNSLAVTDFLPRVTSSLMIYGTCWVTLGNGVSGHCIGCNGFDVSVPNTSSATVTRANLSTITALTSTGGGGENGVGTQHTDGDITDAGGLISQELMSVPITLAGTTITASSVQMHARWDPSKPVDFSITFSRIGIKTYTSNVTIPVMGVTGTTDNGTAINLGAVTTGIPATQQLTITNSGTAIDTLGTLNIVGTGWTISGGDDPSGLTVAMAGSRTVTVSLTAASAGVKTAVLTIPSNDPDTPFLVNLTATASDPVAGGPPIGSMGLLGVGK